MAIHFSSPHTFPGDPVTYIAPSWDNLTDLAFAVAQQAAKQDQRFDRIVSLAKGGWPMARTLADFLNIREGSSMGTKLYLGINSTMKEPQIYQDLHDVTGEKILIFDDVADTGQTLMFVKDHLLKQGVTDIKTATLFHKPHSSFKPDYFGAETDSWIIFPYEIIEMNRLLEKKWLDSGVSATEITTRLQSLGFKQEWIQYSREHIHT